MDTRWLPREIPLPVAGVAARGDAARALAHRLLLRSDDALAALTGVAAPDARLIVVLGPEDALPWTDGAVYLGIDPDAPTLRPPATRRPDTPIDLWAPPTGTAALLPPDADGPTEWVPLDDARPIHRATLERRFP